MYYTSKEAYQFAFDLIHDPIVEWRTCTISGQEFPITQSDMKYYETITPVFDGERFPICLPTLCPEERHRRRISRRNMHTFYKDICDLTGRSMISTYNGIKPYTVYHQEVRRSDARDPMTYAREYDFTRPFFTQLAEHILAVPRMALVNSNTVNSEYSNYIKDAKNCYMSSVLYFGCEDISYSTWIMRSKSCSDCYEVRQGELCYDCTSSTNIFHCVSVHESYDSKYCLFSANLNACTHCIYSYNLSGKSYCIANIQYSKEEYLAKLKEIQSATDYRSESQSRFQSLLQSRRLRATWTINSEGSIGNNIYNGKNAVFVFGGQDYQDVKYLLNSEMGSNNMDMTGGVCERCFESTNVGLDGTTNLIGCISVIGSHHSYYCDNCYYCAYCFGCAGLRNKEYCIFNKQYTKDERFAQMKRIATHMIQTEEWGCFPPIVNGEFAYNETYAHDLFPLTKEEALNFPSGQGGVRGGLQRGLQRYEEEKKPYSGPSITPLPISEYDPSQVGGEQASANRKELLAGVIVCSITGKGFKIVPIEIDLCVRLSIPIATIHPDQRFLARYPRIGKTAMFLRKCSKTNVDILSVYPPDISNPVYAEKVWDAEVYG